MIYLLEDKYNYPQFNQRECQKWYIVNIVRISLLCVQKTLPNVGWGQYRRTQSVVNYLLISLECLVVAVC